MAVTISIDTGGTYTDGYFTDGEKTWQVKADTTPVDLTEGFMNCLKKGAQAMGYKDLRELLRNTQFCRFSTTLATNAIIQKSGPRLGLLVTEGFEESLFGGQKDDCVLDPLIDRSNVIGIRERVTGGGELAVPVDKEEVLAKVKDLLMNGCRVIVVSLKNADKNNSNERVIKEIVNEAYPPHYLGAVPVLLSCDLTSTDNDALKTYTSVVNAYIHPEAAKYLYKADEMVRAYGLRNPLLVVHNDGGTARVAKTRAIDTYNSGPAAAVTGALFWAQKYDHESVLTVDVGGTSTDIGVIRRKQLLYSSRYDIEGIPIDEPCINITAVGGGGGSIVHCSPELQVGPRSAGALPGPACYDLGGSDPTVTDAWVILGMVNPQFFLGGERKLSKELALRAFGEISEKLGQGVEMTAFQAIRKLESEDAQRIVGTVGDSGEVPKVMYVYGGAGGSACCGVAEALGIENIYTFTTNAVFSSFGASRMDIAHVYDENAGIPVNDTQIAEKVGEILSTLEERSIRDMRGEGFGHGRIQFDAIVTLKNRDGNTFQFTVQDHDSELGELKHKILQALRNNPLVNYSDTVHRIRLCSMMQIPKHELSATEMFGTDSSKAIKERRLVFWGERYEETPIFDYTLLSPGNTVEGPAIIESPLTTYIICGSWEYHVDKYMNGVWKKRNGGEYK